VSRKHKNWQYQDPREGLRVEDATGLASIGLEGRRQGTIIKWVLGSGSSPTIQVRWDNGEVDWLYEYECMPAG
jgi:hypothetical protein